MTKYKLNEWVTRPFSRHWTNIVGGNFADPQLASEGANDLLCYDRNAGSGAIFATVKSGYLDDGAPVGNGPVQVGGALTSTSGGTRSLPDLSGKAVLKFCSMMRPLGSESFSAWTGPAICD